MRKLPRPKTYVEDNYGFKGLKTDTVDEVLPRGYISEMENLTISKEDGTLQAIHNPTIIGSAIAATSIKTIFNWRKDDGTETLLAQCGTGLYKWTGSAWSSIKTFSTDEKVSIVSGMLNKLYVLNPTDGLFDWDGITFSTVIAAAPKGQYMELWYNKLFICGEMNDGTYTPYRVRWSALNDPTTWAANDHIDFRTPENSQVTGMKGYKQALYITTASSISIIVSVTSFANYFIYSGSLSPIANQIVTTDGFYYAASTGLYALENDDTPFNLTDPYKEYWSSSNPQSLVYFDDNLYYLNNDNIMLYSLTNKTYERRVYADANVLYAADHLYMGTTDGKVYKLDVAASGYLSWSFKTRVHNFNLPLNKKRPVELIIRNKLTTAETTYTVSAYYDYGTSTALGTVTIAAGTGVTESAIYTYRDLLTTMKIGYAGTGEFDLLGYSIVIKPERRLSR